MILLEERSRLSKVLSLPSSAGRQTSSFCAMFSSCTLPNFRTHCGHSASLFLLRFIFLSSSDRALKASGRTSSWLEWSYSVARVRQAATEVVNWVSWLEWRERLCRFLQKERLGRKLPSLFLLRDTLLRHYISKACSSMWVSSLPAAYSFSSLCKFLSPAGSCLILFPDMVKDTKLLRVSREEGSSAMMFLEMFSFFNEESSPMRVGRDSKKLVLTFRSFRDFS